MNSQNEALDELVNLKGKKSQKIRSKESTNFCPLNLSISKLQLIKRKIFSPSFIDFQLKPASFERQNPPINLINITNSDVYH